MGTKAQWVEPSGECPRRRQGKSFLAFPCLTKEKIRDFVPPWRPLQRPRKSVQEPVHRRKTRDSLSKFDHEKTAKRQTNCSAGGRLFTGKYRI